MHRRKRTVTAAILTGALMPLTFTLLSCGGPSRPPATETPAYEQLRDTLGRFDFSPLKGRRIALDPGHGGVFRGAIGLNGLSEAEVNLGVALYLRGLLEWAGAEVHLTRTADYDFLTAADSSLAADLAARMAIVDSLQPDVFLSIHHNSNAQLDRDLNETQTYYPVGRDGADLDLARSIHRYLVRNLMISPAKIMAGNFYVLRNSPVPAVLGEPSMISNPIIEKRLGLAAKQELEAKAYFLGLLDYFAGGTPHWIAAPSDSLGIAAAASCLTSWRFDPGPPPSPPLDPSTIAFKVDGEPRAFSLSAEATTLTWRVPPEAMAGRHRIELTACNTRGRATPLLDIVLTGPQEIGFHCPLWLPADEEGTLLRFESLGADLADYRRLRLVWRSAAARQEIELPVYPGRRGWVRLALKSWPDSCEIIWDEESTGTTGMRPVPARKALPPEWQWKTLLPAEVAWPLEVVPGGAWRLRALGRQEELASWPEALDTTSPILPVKRGEPAWLEADGAMPIVIGGNRRPLAAEPGAAASDTARWRPILPELIGKRIVLDPTGGGSETDGAGPAGTRGADFNLQVAERTASLLRGAGAVVVLTRRNESWLPSEEKVLLANRQQADLFMIIQRCHETGYRFSAHHHATSLAGLRWSKLWARCIALLTTPGGGSDPEVGSVLTAPSYAYLLRHTACPALQVGLEAPVTHEIEDRLLDPACQQAQAIALFLSIASFTAGADLLDDLAQPLEIIASRSDSFPAPDRIDWIRWDGNWLWIPPRAGASRQQAVSLYRAPGLPFRGGEHTLEIHARGEWQLWSLSKSGDGSGIRLAPLLAGADQP